MKGVEPPPRNFQGFFMLKIMDILTLERHKLIIKKSNELLEVVFDIDKKYITNILNNSKEKLQSYNDENIVISDTTNLENGVYKGVIKKIMYAEFFKKYIHNVDEEKYTSKYCKTCGVAPTYETCDDCSKIEIKLNNKIEKSERIFTDINNTFNECIDNFKPSLYLKHKYIYIKRKSNWYNLNPLEKAIKLTIKTELIKQFYEQNKQILIKTQLNYETSK